MFGQARNWTRVAKLLSQFFRVVALDLRNHGESGWADEMDYPAMAGDVAETMRALGLAPCPVIGHSMGGKVAMALALARPELVSALIVVDIAPVPYRSANGAYVRAMAAIDLSRLTRRAEVEEALAPAVPDRMIRAFLLQNLAVERGRLSWRLNVGAMERAMDVLAGFPDQGGRTYEGPTLFVTGQESDYVRPEHRPAIQALFPRARFAAVKNAAHWVHADQPDSFAAIASGFLGH
jgi:pimeloyl-ACP methyl ester carboxylesterase